MRHLITGMLILLSSFAAFSQSNLRNVEAPGGIIYSSQEGTLEKVNATLSLPPMGRGDLYLKMEGHPSIKASDFFAFRKNGRRIFYVVFPLNRVAKLDLELPAPSIEGRNFVLRGTYVRGSNLALYYGDIFVGDANARSVADDEISDGTSFDYLGGFHFKVDIEGGRGDAFELSP